MTQGPQPIPDLSRRASDASGHVQATAARCAALVATHQSADPREWGKPPFATLRAFLPTRLTVRASAPSPLADELIHTPFASHETDVTPATL